MMAMRLPAPALRTLPPFSSQRRQAAIAAVQAHPEIQGLVVTSAKSTFIVGADITEFGENFAQGEQVIQDWLVSIHQVFNSFEDLLPWSKNLPENLRLENSNG